MRQTGNALVAAILLVIAAIGLGFPDAAAELADRRLENRPMEVEIEKVSISYMTEMDLCEKLLLLQRGGIAHSMHSEGDMTCTEADIAVSVLGYLRRVFGDRKDRAIDFSMEPMLFFFDSGESLKVWRVYVYGDWAVEGYFLLDDETGMILSFNLFGVEMFESISASADEVLSEAKRPGIAQLGDFSVNDEISSSQYDAPREQFSEEIASAFADALFECYGLEGCYYEGGLTFIPTDGDGFAEIPLYAIPEEFSVAFNS